MCRCFRECDDSGIYPPGTELSITIDEETAADETGADDIGEIETGELELGTEATGADDFGADEDPGALDGIDDEPYTYGELSAGAEDVTAAMLDSGADEEPYTYGELSTG